MIELQRPDATRVAGYRTWQEEFGRHVKQGESGIWAPIITNQCPECRGSPSYHDDSDCEYDETPPEEWSEGVVGFKPIPVFGVSQTNGIPLPGLKTEAAGNGTEFVPTLLDAGDGLGVDVRVVPASD